MCVCVCVCIGNIHSASETVGVDYSCTEYKRNIMNPCECLMYGYCYIIYSLAGI